MHQQRNDEMDSSNSYIHLMTKTILKFTWYMRLIIILCNRDYAGRLDSQNNFSK